MSINDDGFERAREDTSQSGLSIGLNEFTVNPADVVTVHDDGGSFMRDPARSHTTESSFLINETPQPNDIRVFGSGFGSSFSTAPFKRNDISIDDPDVITNVNDFGGLERSYNSKIIGPVEIVDEPEEQETEGKSLAEQSRKTFIRWYYFVLVIIGWRKFFAGSKNSSFGMKVLNRVYPVFVCLALLAYYVMAMVTCVSSADNAIFHSSWDGPYGESNVTSTAMPSTTTPMLYEHGKCQNRLSVFVIPFFFNFLTFLAGVWYTRLHRSESLYALIEEVLIRAEKSQVGRIKAPKVVSYLRVLIVGSIVWGLAGLGLQILYYYAFIDTAHVNITYTHRLDLLFGITNEYLVAFLVVMKYVGGFISAMVYAAATLNYAAQCNMIGFKLDCIVNDIRQKTTSLSDAFRDVFTVQAQVNTLNSATSKLAVVSTVSYLDALLEQVLVLVIDWNEKDQVPYNGENYAYRVLAVILWGIAFLVSIVEPARVYTKVSLLRKAAVEMRVFGFPRSSQLDLDSFLNFMDFVEISPKLLYIKIKPSSVVTLILLSFIALLVLMQLNILLAEAKW